MYSIVLMVLWHWIYTEALYIPTVHYGILHLDSPHPNPQCVTAHPTILWENEGSTSMYITPFIDHRDEIGSFESTRLWSTTSKQATRQLLLCYRRKPQSKCSVLLVEAELHHNVPHTCEERCLHSSRWRQRKKKKSREMHVNAPALPTSGFGVEKKRHE